MQPTISPDDLLMLLGSKEAELFLAKQQTNRAVAERDAAKAAVGVAEAEVVRLREEAAAAKAAGQRVAESLWPPLSPESQQIVDAHGSGAGLAPAG